MTKADLPAHIMVINDVPDLLEVLQQLLVDEGYRVSIDSFSNFDLAKTFAGVKHLKPDVLVLDLMIGAEALGWQLLQRIKLDRELENMAIVLCTAAVHRVEELAPHLRTMGVAVVIKPFDIDGLLEIVAQALSGGPLMGKATSEDN